MVAGDLVNTASRIQSVGRARARSSSARRRGARPSRRSPTRTPACTSSRARPSRAAVAGAAGRLRRAGSLKSAGLEAPFVGRDRELRLIKELFHASATDAAAPTSSRSPASPASASRGWPGSSTSTSTACRHGLVAPRPLPLLRRGRHVLGAGGHGADALPHRRGRGAGVGARQARRRRSRSTCSTRRSGASSSRGWRTCSAWRRAPRSSATDLFAAWRLFFERLADT